MKRAGHNIGWIIATWFGAGLLPKAPGTWGSLAALPFAYVISAYTGAHILITGIVFLFCIGTWVSNKVEESAQKKDPGFIVVDEVVGQWIALLPLPFLYDYFTPYLSFFPVTGVSFLTFRLFDIWKPWPIKHVEKKLPGGLGIMVDDVIAGIYALITTTVLVTVIILALYILYPAFLSHYIPEK